MDNRFIIFLIVFIYISGTLLALGSREQVSEEREFIYVEYEDKFGAYCNEKIVFNIKHNLDISSIVKIELEFIWRKNFVQSVEQFRRENIELSLERQSELEEIFMQNFDHSMEELTIVDKQVYYFFPSENITFEYWVGVGGWNDTIDDNLQKEMFADVSDEYFIILIWLNNRLIYENKEFWVGCSSIF